MKNSLNKISSFEPIIDSQTKTFVVGTMPSVQSLNDNEYYLINFNDTDATLEVYNTQGYDGKYSLTEIDKLD